MIHSGPALKKGQLRPVFFGSYSQGGNYTYDTEEQIYFIRLPELWGTVNTEKKRIKHKEAKERKERKERKKEAKKQKRKMSKAEKDKKVDGGSKVSGTGGEGRSGFGGGFGRERNVRVEKKYVKVDGGGIGSKDDWEVGMPPKTIKQYQKDLKELKEGIRTGTRKAMSL